jgi:hypothetical protein
MEHEIFRVVVRSGAKGVRLTLEDHPRICVAGRTREEAEEALLDRIAEKFGDGEPVLDFCDQEEKAPTELWVFRSNERVTTLNVADLYSDGVCERCGVGLGSRKATVQRRVREVIKGDVAFTSSGPVLGLVLSEKMMDVLKEGGLSQSDFAPVADKQGRVYGEVLASSARIEWVPVKKQVGVRVGAQRCPRCGFSIFGFVHLVDKDIRRFAAKADERELLQGVCIVGTNEPEPVLSSAVREAIRKRKELRGFVWGRVGLVTSTEIESKLKYDAFPKP